MDSSGWWGAAPAWRRSLASPACDAPRRLPHASPKSSRARIAACSPSIHTTSIPAITCNEDSVAPSQCPWHNLSRLPRGRHRHPATIRPKAIPPHATDRLPCSSQLLPTPQPYRVPQPLQSALLVNTNPTLPPSLTAPASPTTCATTLPPRAPKDSRPSPAPRWQNSS